jgi:general secretion pathway protein H
MSAYRDHRRTFGGMSGFSLFELLVVILIIGLISALVMPRMAATLPGVQLKSTARAVAASLRYARSRAVYESTPYMAVFDNAQKLLAVEPIDRPMDASELKGLRKILDTSEFQKVYKFDNGIEFYVLNENGEAEDMVLFPILFFPRGDSTGGKIVLKNLRRKQFMITVDTFTGTIEIERPKEK